MPRPIAKILGLALLFAFCSVAATAASERPFVHRLRVEGVRLAHLSGVEGSVDAMAKAGCNAMMLQTWSLGGVKKTTSPDSEEIITDADLQPLRTKLGKHAAECKRANVLAFSTIYGLSEVEAAILAQHDYDHIIDAEGRQGIAIPCPLSRRYWMGFILPQFLAQARALRDADVPGGAIIDLEHYNQEVVFAWDWDICYCDACWKAFCRKTNKDREVTSLPPASRGQWVGQNGLSRQYKNLMSRRLTGLMREIAAKCRQVDPDFLLGFYPYVPNWYCDAILRAWGTRDLPALAMSETEREGYQPWSSPRVEHLRSTGLNALYVSVLWQGACYPTSYGARAEELVRKTDGYWLYYAAMFFNPALKKITLPHKGTEYTIAAPPTEYLDALSRANRRLDNAHHGSVVL